MALIDPYSAVVLITVTTTSKTKKTLPSSAVTLSRASITGTVIDGAGEARSSVSKMMPIKKGATASSNPTTVTRNNEAASTQP